MAVVSLSNARFSLGMTGTMINTLVDGKSTQVQAAMGDTSLVNKNLASGAEADKANRFYQITGKVLASGASITYDLYDFQNVDIGAGIGRDALGQLIVHEEIVGIIVSVTDGTGSLEVIPHASNGWSPIGSHTVATKGALRKGGVLAKFQPDEDAFDVTHNSNHRIQLTANGGSVTFSLHVMARHDDDVSSSSSSSSSSSTSSQSSSSSSTSSQSSSSTSSQSSSSQSSSSSSSTSSQSSSSSSST